MPTFFSRRYMREKPGPVERWVGVFVLVLLVFILGTFLLTGGLFQDSVSGNRMLSAARSMFGISEKPLFTVAPENLKPPAPPHEARAANAMLPVLPEPWKRGEVQVVALRADENPANGSTPPAGAGLTETLLVFGGRWLYGTQYRKTTADAGSGGLAVSIADLAEPANAFGAWRSRRPEDAQPVAIGRDGWQVDSPPRVGFWSGRYYTELSVRDLPLAELESLARVIASVQLVYGGPFWAESVLPSEGRVDGSFRYVRKEALGLQELSDCWLADYPDSLTVGVMQPASPGKVLDALRARRASAAEAGEGDHEGGGDSYGSDESGPALPTQLPPGGVAGSVGGRVIAAFETGPYLFVVAGAKSPAVQTVALAVAERWQAPSDAGQWAAAPADTGRSTAPGQARFAEVPGSSVQMPTQIERYAENLYEKINGKEGLFRAYYVVDLKFGRYLDPDRQQSFDVYIYDMREPANALGIFMLERSEKAVALDLGRDGYESGTSAYFWKGRYYVNVLGPGEGGPAALATSKQIAASIAETIADSGERFWAEALLPDENRVPHSFTYQASSALGYDFLQRVYVAKYAVDGKSSQLYVLRAASPAAARDLFGQFAEATAKYDKIVSREPSEGGETLVFDSLGVFGAAFHKGVYFAGVSECDDQALAAAQAEAFRARLSADDAGEAAPSVPAVSEMETPSPAAAPSDNEHSEEGGESGY